VAQRSSCMGRTDAIEEGNTQRNDLICVFLINEFID
jgi:hypothetical protein